MGRLGSLTLLSPTRASDAINRTTAMARESLGMDVAFVSQFAGDQMEFRGLEGEAESFGLREGVEVPLEGTYCKLLVDGDIPNVIPDTRNDGRVSDLEITRRAGVGSYVGLPVRFSDGRVYGTLCCMSHCPEPHLQENATPGSWRSWPACWPTR